MNFASPFVWVADNAEAECEYFDDDLLTNLNEANQDNLSDDEDGEIAPPPQKEEKKLRRIRKADTNVCAVNLGLLGTPLPLFTGDPITCKSCSVYFTESSKITGDKFSGPRWICEYCASENIVSFDCEEEEIPKGDSIDYLLSPPSFETGEQNDLVIFCVDVSGSMCCTSEVRGDFKIRRDAALQASLQEFLERAPGGALADQWMPNQERGVTYVSRLQCVQAAVSDQIEKMAKSFPSKRVVLITFSNDVTVHLPGGKQHVITGDKLHDWDYLANFRASANVDLSTPVKESEKEMVSTILGLNEGGATALGPALLVAVSLGGERRGSSVVLCTDGVANIGLGSLEDLNEFNVNDHPAPLFYGKLAEHALNVGTSVSIVSIKGSNSRLEYIAKVSAETRGMNDIVDPLDLSKNFNFILENAIVATDVSVTMFLHKALKFRHEKGAKGKTSSTRLVGNVLKESCITFEYAVGDTSLLGELKAVPFQLQIKYTKMDGTKCLRVMSKEELVTKDRAAAEKNVNVGVIGIHSAQQVAAYASDGNYGKARMYQKANMRMLKRGVAHNPDASEEQRSQMGAYNREAVKLNSAIKKNKVKEMKSGFDAGYNSAEEDDSGSEEDEIQPGVDRKDVDAKPRPTVDRKANSEKSEKKKAMRQKREVDRAEEDDFSNALYGAQNPLFSDYL